MVSKETGKEGICMNKYEKFRNENPGLHIILVLLAIIFAPEIIALIAVAAILGLLYFISDIFTGGGKGGGFTGNPHI
jgi:hypothetical protein